MSVYILIDIWQSFSGLPSRKDIHIIMVKLIQTQFSLEKKYIPFLFQNTMISNSGRLLFASFLWIAICSGMWKHPVFFLMNRGHFYKFNEYVDLLFFLFTFIFCKSNHLEIIHQNSIRAVGQLAEREIIYILKGDSTTGVDKIAKTSSWLKSSTSFKNEKNMLLYIYRKSLFSLKFAVFIVIFLACSYFAFSFR